MTVPSTPSEISYATDGVTDDFPIPFAFDTSADIVAKLTDSAGNPAPFTAFAVTGGGGGTGTLTTNSVLASGSTLTIFDDPEQSQETDYVDNDEFPAPAHERALDKVTRLVKRLSIRLTRSLHTADGDPVTDLTLGSVDNRKGKYLFFNAVTGAVEYAVALATTALSQSIIGQLLNPQTASESAALVVPSDYAPRVIIDVQRYGALPGASGATNLAAINKASAVALAAGGGLVVFGEGTYSVNGSILMRDGVRFKGAGPEATIISYTGSAQAFKSNTTGTRTYDQGISDLTIKDDGTGTIGIDLDSISTSQFSNVIITNFDTAVRVYSPTNGYAVYNRFYNVTAQGCTKGFSCAGVGSNATHFIACRFNGSTAVGTTAWELIDANGCSVTNSDIDVAGVGFALTAPSGAGFTDGNYFAGNRIEGVTTAFSLAANVRYTQIEPQLFVTVTTPISDSGTRNNFRSPPHSAYEKYAGVASASGIKRIENTADQGATPFLVVADNAASTAGAIALQLENTNAGGILAKGAVSGTEKFSIDSGGKLNIQQVVLKQVVPTVAAGQVGLGSTTQTTVGAAGGASALPATPTGYLIINVAGTNRVIPFYAAS